MRARSIGQLAILCVSLWIAACGDGGPPGVPDAAPAPGDAASPAPDTAPTVGPVEFEVAHYDYTFDLASRQARSVLTIAVLTPGNCVPIPFRPSAAQDVALDGEPADPVTIEGGVLTACSAAASFAPGQTITLAAAFEVPQRTQGASQIGFSARADLEGHLFYYLVSWFEGCDRFGPCDPRPDRFATYRFTVTHAAGVRVLCPGLVTEGGSSTVCDFPYAGGPTYSTFGFAAGSSWEDVDLGTFAGIHLRLHDEPQSGIAERFNAAEVGAFLAWMQDAFGPYPYGTELRYVVGETYWWGFEHPGNIVLSNTLGAPAIVYADDLTHVAMHEAAHMWAGDQVTLASTRDFFWKEALAEYLTFVYEDDTFGAAASALTAAYWKEAAAIAEYYPAPDDETDLFVYYGDAYGAGPVILFGARRAALPVG
jgi:aminopeptidase N